MQEFADKLILCQEHDVQITINQVMVPEHFERDWENALFFHEQGINVHLQVPPNSISTVAQKVVDGYTEDNPKRLERYARKESTRKVNGNGRFNQAQHSGQSKE